MRLSIWLLAVAVLVCALPGRAQDSSTEAQAAFARLKQLRGDWQATGGKDKVERLSYRVVANGSAIEETYTGSEGEMLSVYTLDGNRVLLTHYCVAHNQPRMEAKVLRNATLEFQFVDASGLSSPGAGHMHNAAFQFIDEDHIRQTWHFVENGKDKFTESMEYARLR